MTVRAKAPRHLWVIGILALLWNAVGAMDYVMTKSKVDWYIAALTPEQLDYFTAFPAWVTATWAIGVWFSVLGAILLLLRNRYAPVAFAISLLGMIATTLYNYVLSPIKAQDVTGDFAIYFSILIFFIGVALWLYARVMRIKGVLA